MKECGFSRRARSGFSASLDDMGESDPGSALDFVTRLAVPLSKQRRNGKAAGVD